MIKFIDEMSKYRIRKRFRVKLDRDSRVFSIIPTVDFHLWSEQKPGTFAFVFRWLNIRIGMGVWEKRKEDI